MPTLEQLLEPEAFVRGQHVFLLQQAIDAGYFLPDIRVEAQQVACRLVNLLEAGR